MLFNIEHDGGRQVIGYVVPDAFSTIPKLLIRSGDRTLVAMDANDRREALVTAGRHETGQCGFVLNEELIPRLADIADLEIVEAETGVLIYRRPPPNAIMRKVFRVETHLLPYSRFDHALSAYFQYSAIRVEQFGRETTTQMMMLNFVHSQYISGRIYYKNYANEIEKFFDKWIFVTSPYKHFAERILVLRHVRAVGMSALGPRDAIFFAPAIEFCEELDIDNPKKLQQAFKTAPSEVIRAVADPLVRQLTCSAPDEMPRPGAVAASLDALAGFQLVRPRDEPEQNFALASALLGRAVSPTPIPSVQMVNVLAKTLEEVDAVEALLEHDLELHHYMTEASNKAFGDP